MGRRDIRRAYHPPASATAASWASLTLGSSSPFNDISAFPIDASPSGSATYWTGSAASKYLDGQVCGSAGFRGSRGRTIKAGSLAYSRPVPMAVVGARHMERARRRCFADADADADAEGGRSAIRGIRARVETLGRLNRPSGWCGWMAGRSSRVRAPLIPKRRQKRNGSGNGKESDRDPAEGGRREAGGGRRETRGSNLERLKRLKKEGDEMRRRRPMGVEGDARGGCSGSKRTDPFFFNRKERGANPSGRRPSGDEDWVVPSAMGILEAPLHWGGADARPRGDRRPHLKR